MKKKFLTGLVVTLGMALGMTSCSDESSSTGSGMGRISPRVVVDGDVITAANAPGSRANEDVTVTVEDLKLRLTSDDGSYSREWESVNDFDVKQEFKVGEYTLEAYYGNEDDIEGYGKPHFYGKQDISVKYDKTTQVDLNASMKNSRVVIKYTDAFKNYMTSYSVQLHTPKGKYIDVAADEVNPVYVAPGTVNVNLKFVKPNGNGATIEAARFDAKAKTEHVVTIDLNGGDSGADAILKVTFDDTVDTEDVEIDLSDDLVNAPAPEVTTEGWTTGQSFTAIQNTLPDAPVKANILARGKIKEVVLNTNSPSLKAEGWPEKVDLVSADGAVIDNLARLGLKTRGLRKNPDMLGVIDFTEVFRNLSVSTGLDQSTHTFSLQVVDRYGKTSEVVDFTVVSILGKIEILSASSSIGSKTVNAQFEFNGSSVTDNVIFQMRDPRGGAWEDLTIASVQEVSEGVYSVKLTSPFTVEAILPLRAFFGSVKSEIDITLNTPPFRLVATPADVYATHAFLTLVCDSADDTIVARAITKVEVDGEATENYNILESEIQITGLTPNTSHTITTYTHDRSASITIQTEEDLQLPNAGMENWYRVKAAHSQTTGFGADAWVWHANAEGGEQFWATRNALTTATSSGPTPNYVSYSGTLSATGKDGLAAEISTIGYGEGSTYTGSGGIRKHMAAGMLFTGTHTATSETEETFEYGKPFTSRPESLSFSYKFAPYNGESFKAYVTIENRENGTTTELGHGELVSGDAVNAFAPATITIDYTVRNLKATHITVVFCSSTAESPEVKNVTGSKGAFQGYTDARRIGSVLTVDNITLNY